MARDKHEVERQQFTDILTRVSKHVRDNRGINLTDMLFYSRKLDKLYCLFMSQYNTAGRLDREVDRQESVIKNNMNVHRYLAGLEPGDYTFRKSADGRVVLRRNMSVSEEKRRLEAGEDMSIGTFVIKGFDDAN